MSNRGQAILDRRKTAIGVVHGGALTEKQLKIETMSLAGKSHRTIAEELGISSNAVANQLEKVRSVRAFEALRRASNGGGS
jgi:DNA-binding CsgD family transcriptional regulator